MAFTSQRCEPNFFGNLHLEGEKRTSLFTDLSGGHDDDSLLLGIAAGLLDKILTHQKVSKIVVGTLIDKYLHYFPEDRKISSNVNAQERLQQLTQHVRIGKLTQKIAYTLEQMGFEELRKNPNDYPEVFCNGQLSPDALTLNKGRSFMTALTAALSLPLEIQIVERDKPLFKRECYNTEQQSPYSVVLQSQDGYYRPRLVSNVFNSAQVPPLSQLHQQRMDNQSTHSHKFLSEMSIAPTENERLIALFEEVYRPLFAMVVAGELNIEHLKEIYAKSTTPCNDALSKSQPIRSNIFDKVVASQNNFYKVPLEPQKAQFAIYLVYSIAKAVSFGQMLGEQVFNLANDLQTTGTASPKIKH